jgi:hypothetical protein
MEKNDWVEQQMAQLAPPDDWKPDVAAAIRRHRTRRLEQWRRGPGFWWKLAMAVGLILAIAAVPPARALAQRLWRFLTVGRIEVVQVNLDLLPKESSLRARQVRPPERMIKVATPEEAYQRIGFLPKLPFGHALRGEPKLSVMNPLDYELQLKLDDLHQLLQGAGMTHEALPREWDGARIIMHIGGTVMAEWPESDAMLIQSPPMTLAVPDGFDLIRFTTLVLRGLGLPPGEAERLGAQMAATPAGMLALGAEDKVGIRQVKLRHGTGTLVYDYDTDRPDRVERLTLLWSTPDRIYVLSCGCGDAAAIATADDIQ